jgi:hypothetical protein
MTEVSVGAWLSEPGRFDEWPTDTLVAQCRMQARDSLDPDYIQFMNAVADRLSRPAGGGWREIDEMLTDEIDLFREVKRQGARKRIDVVRVSLARIRECLRLPALPAAPSSNNGESE